jgi:hypothetical protein
MGFIGIGKLVTSTVGKSTNILWHDCPIGQNERQNLLNQKGCVVWITGLSGSGLFELIKCTWSQTEFPQPVKIYQDLDIYCRKEHTRMRTEQRVALQRASDICS